MKLTYRNLFLLACSLGFATAQTTRLREAIPDRVNATHAATRLHGGKSMAVIEGGRDRTLTVSVPAVAQSTQYLMTRAKPAACTPTSPPTAVATFLPTDSQAVLWFYVTGLNVGDIASSEYYAPNGQFYAPNSGSWPGATGGNICYNDDPLLIAGYQPASLTGTWTVKVKINGAVLFTLTFNIGTPSASQVTTYLMTRSAPTACDPSNPPAAVTKFLSTDPKAVLWFYVLNVHAGDIASTEFYTPAGDYYAAASAASSARQSDSNVCYFNDLLQIAGAQPANLPGIWTVKGKLNSVELFSLKFEIAQAGPTPPAIQSSGGVVNGASFSNGLASGTWMTVRGTNLSTTTRSWQGSDFSGANLPTALDGVQVKINGVPAYVAFISPTQVNVLAPDDATTGAVSVQVINGAGTSNTFSVTKQAVAPALFTLSQGDARYPVAQDPTYALVAPPNLLGSTVTTRPASPGQSLTLHATGLGATSPASPAGRLVDTPAALAAPIQVQIGSVSAAVQFAGLIGPGLYQINVVVPDLLGGEVPIVITVNGVTSPTVYLPVRTARSLSIPAYKASTIAGNHTSGYSGDGGPATAAQLSGPEDAVVDASGNMYIADINRSIVRKVTPAGVISTFAGTGSAGFSGDGGPATSARLNAPVSLALDKAGNLYIATTYRVRKVTPAGIISTVAGNGSTGYTGDGGPATGAAVDVEAVDVDAAGNLYIADLSNHVIRKVDTSGIITTVAGNGTPGYSGDGGPARSAQLRLPTSVAVDSAGNLYIGSVVTSAVRKVSPSGIITTVAGGANSGYTGDGGPAVNAQLTSPGGVATDSAGNLYIFDSYRYVIRKVDPSGTITTLAGTGSRGYSGDGGLAPNAELSYGKGIFVDANGKIYIADTNNDVIRLLTPQ